MRHVVVVVALAAIAACTRSEFVYLYDCGGTISKFDLISKQKIGEWHTSDIAGLADVVPLPVRDGCTLNNVRYEAGSAEFIAVAPLSPVMTADASQRYVLLTISLRDMSVTAHVELPQSATIPNLMPPNKDELVVGYEVPRDDAPNESWRARYRAETLEALGPPRKGGQLPAVEAARPLPAEIPVPDQFTHLVFTDR